MSNTSLLADRSIKHKQTAVIMVTTALALLLACAAFFVYDYSSIRSALNEELATISRMMAFGSQAAVEFEDSDAAAETLEALVEHRQIAAGAIYQADDQLFATYLRPGEKVTIPQEADESEVAGYITQRQPIIVDGERIGSIYVLADTKLLQSRQQRLGLIALGVLLVSTLVAFLFAARMGRVLVDPIMALASNADKIKQGDYTIRAEKRGQDELGELVDGFNEMLGAIQSRDKQLAEMALFPELNPAPVLKMDRKGSILLANLAAREIFGSEELTGESWYRLCSQLGQDDVLQGALKAAENGFGIAQQEAAIGNQTFLFTYQVAPQGDYVNVYGADATDLRRTTKELEKARDEAETANRFKSEFLANMSHELRTPLNAVLGLSEAMQLGVYGDLGEKHHKALLQIQSSGHHLLDLINDVLDISKIEANSFELELGNVSVPELCEASISFVTEEARRKEITLSTNISEAVGVICADERRMKQVLVNLLHNAVKFTRTGGMVSLEVEALESVKAVSFTIADTGIGIPEDRLDRLFKPFSQADSSLAREFGGTGLGLSLVYSFVNLHSGSVSVETDEGKGSRFTVTVPWLSLRPTETYAPENTIPPNQDYQSVLKKALLVEDSTITCEQVTRYLSGAGISTVVHSQGNGTIDKVMEHKPGVILLDLRLPDITGWQVLEDLKNNPETQHIPVVIISMFDDRAMGLEKGAVDYLVKPVTADRLEESLKLAALGVTGKQGLSTTVTSHDEEGEVRKILLVEDNEANIGPTSDFLESRGYQVTVARNGIEAVHNVKITNPDLILMDVQMPEMDGLEATRRIRGDLKLEVPIIALTALAMPGDRERCMEAGVNDYMCKPVSYRGLVEAMDRLLTKAPLS